MNTENIYSKKYKKCKKEYFLIRNKLILSGEIKLNMYGGENFFQRLFGKKSKKIKVEVQGKIVKMPKGKALIDIDKIKEKGTVNKTQIANIKRSDFKRFLRWVYSSMKLTVSAGATVASLGAGGDTIPDIIFLIMDVSFLVSNIASIIKLGSDISQWIVMIFSDKPGYNRWTGKPEDVKTFMETKIFPSIEQNPQATAIYSKLCAEFIGIIDNIAAAFGSLISTFIPDDAGIARFAIESVIMTMASYSGPYDFLAKAYNKIPAGGREILGDEQKLKEFILNIIGYMRNLFPAKGDTFSKTMKKNFKRYAWSYLIFIVVSILPGGILISGPLFSTLTVGNVLTSTNLTGQSVINIIDKHILPNIDTYVQLIRVILSVTFAISVLVEKCTQGANITGTIMKQIEQKPQSTQQIEQEKPMTETASKLVEQPKTD
jgi:hypothetical protein